MLSLMFYDYIRFLGVLRLYLAFQPRYRVKMTPSLFFSVFAALSSEVLRRRARCEDRHPRVQEDSEESPELL